MPCAASTSFSAPETKQNNSEPNEKILKNMSVRCLEKLARAGGRALFLVNSMAVCVTALLPPPAYYSNPYIVFAFCVQLPTSLPLSPSQRPINSAWKVRFRGCWTLWLIAGQFVSLRPWTDIGRQWQRGSPLNTESPLVTPRGLRWATKGLLRTVALAEKLWGRGSGWHDHMASLQCGFCFLDSESWRTEESELCLSFGGIMEIRLASWNDGSTMCHGMTGCPHIIVEWHHTSTRCHQSHLAFVCARRGKDGSS